LIERREGGGRQAWGAPADNKIESSWGRSGVEGSAGAGDRWAGSSGLSGSQRGGQSSYGGSASNLGGSMYMSSLSQSSRPTAGSSLLMGSSGMSRQQDKRFNISAITARRF